MTDIKQKTPYRWITPKQAEERGIPMGTAGYIWVDDEAAKTAVIGKPYSVHQAQKDFDEAYEEAAAENAKACES